MCLKYLITVSLTNLQCSFNLNLIGHSSRLASFRRRFDIKYLDNFKLARVLRLDGAIVRNEASRTIGGTAGEAS